MPVFFALTLALGAALLFAVQPLAARAALPVLGGSPAVWNTSMVFFQAVVLGGYAAAHLLARRTRPRVQATVFVLVIVLGALALPPSPAGSDIQPPEQPLLWLLLRLTTQLALPCFALALASPLLQHWFTRTSRKTGEPYFLYSASNAGSLAALLAYPLLFEPRLDLDVQASAWSITYGLWGLLIAAAAALQWRDRDVTAPSIPSAAPARSQPAKPRMVLTWIALGAVPASLLQGCTLFLTTDVASVPLLWVVPLALYLITFIVAFARNAERPIRVANRILPFLACALIFAILSRATQPVALLIALHLAFLITAGVVCHGRLVSLRPAPERLTAFYLALAAGGVLGGAFNALLAPHLFRTVAEYPIAIALACAALPTRTRPIANSRSGTGIAWTRDLAWAIGLAVLTVTLGLTTPWFTSGNPRLRDALAFGIPAIACCTLLDRPRRLALATASVFAVGLWLQGLWSHNQHVERNFFGVTRVTLDPTAGSHQIVHGNTIHGRQFLDPARRGDPLSYYHRAGPLGRVFEELARNLPADGDRAIEIGVIGLGAGSMAAYARPRENWVFFEIDPAVIRVARNPHWFTFLRDSRAARLDIIEGDARLRLREQPDGRFDLLVLDAFSSDAIPVHLLTREALQRYLQKLRPGGWLVAHISNRYLGLEPVFAALARDAGIACRTSDDTDEDTSQGKEPSHWMVMARTEAALGPLGRRIPWVPADGADRRPPWTDRRAGVLEAFEWR